VDSEDNDQRNNDKVQKDIQDDMIAILGKMQCPYGLMLSHKYCAGTEQFNGFDALLLATARSLYEKVEDTQVHIMPIVTRFRGEYFSDEDRLEDCCSDAAVYPFSAAHVDYLLKDGNDREAEWEEIKWLKGFKNVPFYTMDFKSSVFTWMEEQSDGENYTGNEADSTREDSLHLSYAMVVLPKASP